MLSLSRGQDLIACGIATGLPHLGKVGTALRRVGIPLHRSVTGPQPAHGHRDMAEPAIHRLQPRREVALAVGAAGLARPRRRAVGRWRNPLTSTKIQTRRFARACRRGRDDHHAAATSTGRADRRRGPPADRQTCCQCCSTGTSSAAGASASGAFRFSATSTFQCSMARVVSTSISKRSTISGSMSATST